MATNGEFCLPANPDVSGIGVRAAIYAQNFLSFVPAFYALSDGKVTIDELDSIEAQSSTILITALAILISAIVEGLSHKLSNIHAAIILNLSWMNNTNLFIYFLLYVHYTAGNFGDAAWKWQFWWKAMWDLVGRVCDIPNGVVGEGQENSKGRKWWTGTVNRVLRKQKKTHHSDKDTKSPDAFVVLLGTLHLSLMAGVGIWLWSDPSAFNSSQRGLCPVPPSLVLLGRAVPITSSGLRGFSIFMYSLVLTPLVNIIFPMAFAILFYIQFNRRYQNSPPINVIFKKIVSLFSLQSPFGNAELKDYQIFPISVCLFLLATMNILFVVNTEVTLHQNRQLQEAGESDWSFGQTLAILLLLVPLRDILESFIKRHEGKVQGRIERAHEAASMLREALQGGRLPEVQKLIEGEAHIDWQYEDGNFPILLAASKHQSDIVKYLGDKGAKLNVQDKTGKSPLLLAAFEGYSDIVKYLGDKGAQLDLQDEDGNSSLHYATSEGNSDIVKYLGDKGAQLDLQDKNGKSLLHCAVSSSHSDLVKYLVDKGAQLDLQDKDGNSPLHYATSESNSDIVKYLVNNRAQLDMQNKIGKFPLLLAASQGDSTMLKYLGDKGAQLDLQDEDGNSPLHYAASEGNPDIVKYLVNNRAKLNLQNKNGKAPLHYIVSRNSFNIERYLMNIGWLDVQVGGSNYTRTTLCALCSDDFGIVRYLVDNGAQLDLQDMDGKSPLHYAVSGHYSDDIKNQLNMRAWLTLQDKDGKSPLFCAVCSSGAGIVGYLVGKGAKLDLQDKTGTSTLILAADQGNSHLVEYLGDKGAQLDLQDKDGHAPLHYAASKGKIDIVKYLGDKGTQLDLQGDSGNSALHYAAQKGSSDIVKYLVDKGAQLDLQDKGGKSALICAVQSGDFGTVRNLVDVGAKLDLQDNIGQSPLILAISRDYSDIVKYLVDNGANLDLQDTYGNSALLLATSMYQFGIVKYLESKGAKLVL